MNPMLNIKDKISAGKTVSYSPTTKTARCLSCGTNRIKPGRRYCSKQCRQQIQWVLSLSKGLLKTFNARYAAFYFTREHVVLDVLPAWSKTISSLTYSRIQGNKPAEDLKSLILKAGSDWHRLVNNNTSRSFASLFLLERSCKKHIDPDSIKPDINARPRLSKHETRCLKILKLDREDLSSKGNTLKIKSAYKRMAKLYHPDMGGDEEKFKKLNEAHKEILLWAENPQYTSRKALPNCWSYDGYTNSWSPPL
ncbi:MAG: DnaJ domain-containing protein [Thermodesulfobacteriota bacterium]|nr:DnaJ domain-containing protein [Thermodesulfobacteriota bacterium]